MIVKCKQCDKEFDKNPVDIKRTPNNFCSKSCAGTYNNHVYIKRKKKKYHCIVCGTETLCRRKYCDTCRKDKFIKCAKITCCKIRKPIEFFLVKGHKCNTARLRERLITESFFNSCCQRCHFTEWQGQPISLELHHIDGDKANNLLSNLTILCPNCHALTDTYRGKNKKN